MRRLARGLGLAAAILLLGLVGAGCGHISAGIGAIHSHVPTTDISLPARSATSAPSDSLTPADTPTPTPTATPTVTATSTVTATATATPTASASTPSVKPSSSPAHGGGSISPLTWLWIGLGVLVLIVAIVLISRSAGRRSRAAASWRSRVTDAYAQGAALYDAMSLAETPHAQAATDAGARWFDIERRADDLARTLYALREAAPTDEDRAQLDDTLAALHAVRSAMSAERAPDAGERQAQIARDRLRAFEASVLRSRQGRPYP